MSNEIAINTPTAIAPSPSAVSVSSALAEQVQQMGHAYTLAQSLCKTALVPAQFRGKPEDGAVAIMAGAKWGLDAIASLQNIFIVHGTPSTYARVMKAVVQANGHEIWTEEVDGDRVVVCGRRKGSDRIERSEWTADRARKAGYFTNKKYETELENMLYARATAECARRTAPDCLLGMPYSREELEDTTPRYVPNTAPRGGSVAESIGLAPASDTAPDTEGDEPVDAEEVDIPAEPATTEEQAEPQTNDEPNPPMITAAQLKKLHTVLTKEGLSDRAQSLAWLSEQVKRNLTSSKELTKEEAIDIINWLEKEQAKDATNRQQ